jgi:hypothetical protein
MKIRTTITFLTLTATTFGALRAIGSVAYASQDPASEAPALDLNVGLAPFFWDGETLNPTSWMPSADKLCGIGNMDFPDQSILACVFQEGHVDLGHAISSEARNEFSWLPEALWRTPKFRIETEYLPVGGRGFIYPIILSENESIYLDLHNPDVLSVLDGWQVTGKGDIQQGSFIVDSADRH